MKRSFKCILASRQEEINDELIHFESAEQTKYTEPICLYEAGVRTVKDTNYTALLHTWAVMGKIKAIKSKGRIFLKELDVIITIANLKIYRSWS
jgi:hypothetical protein